MMIQIDDVINITNNKTFKDLGLKITCKTNLTIGNALDVTLDLHNNRYHPYRKPNDTPTYIHTESNHPHCWRKKEHVNNNSSLNHIKLRTNLHKSHVTVKSTWYKHDMLQPFKTCVLVHILVQKRKYPLLKVELFKQYRSWYIEIWNIYLWVHLWPSLNTTCYLAVW